MCGCLCVISCCNLCIVCTCVCVCVISSCNLCIVSALVCAGACVCVGGGGGSVYAFRIAPWVTFCAV